MAFEERYYREELDYLRQLGKLLAQEKPYLARFLAEKEGDPDVERLMEAFAFLSGGLRQKLEDEFPEFTHGLINMLWPNYLRPVPAMAVIEYRPKKELKTPVQVCRDELIKTQAGRSRQLFAQGVFVRENGILLESSRGLSGIDEIKQLFGAKTLTVDTGAGNADEKLTFNIDGLAQTIGPLRDACHWAGE